MWDVSIPKEKSKFTSAYKIRCKQSMPTSQCGLQNRSTDNILKNKALPMLATLSSPKVLWEVISSTEKISDPQQLQYP